ncbi:MAG: hypothetical protein A2W17_07370 [Planctomycetes bacterium RBG_16_41_13]|nr:MAG: hypothetical protein A2W17_07370 [Planctomycetes bacterium RBG_16_41_13]
MRSIKPLYISWIIAVAIIVVISFNHRNETTTFYGAAETREIVINSNRAVEVKEVYVLPGQQVNKGDPLVLLASSWLDKDINDIFHKLKELKEHYNVNRKLVSELKSLQKYYAYRNNAVSETPMQIKTEGREQIIEGHLKSDENPFETQIQRLGKELALLEEEKRKLSVFAPISGKVSTVLCKAGEQVSPHDAILKLHTVSPGFITGYIPENMYAMVYVGQKTKIVSATNPSYNLTGEVVAVGHRTIEYPNRLRNILSAQPLYGREVFVEIPEDNRLLLGEKVIIIVEHETGKHTPEIVKNYHFSENNSTIATVAEKYPVNNNPGEPVAIQADQSLTGGVNIEASGIVYLKDIKKYLVISDTTQNDQLILYVMNNKGNIDDAVYLEGVNKIDDMEAITTDEEGNIFVVCSQSNGGNKKKLPDKRKHLLRIKRNGYSFVLDKKVHLYDLLNVAAGKDKNAQWAQCIAYGDNAIKMNIEGMFYHEDALYFGLKWPLNNGKAVIFKIKNIHEVFDKELLEEGNIELWKEFALQNNSTKTPAGISDLSLYRNNLYILSYGKTTMNGKKKKAGDLWVYDLKKDTLSHMQHFENLKPEGVVFNPDDTTLLLTFDNGHNHPSKIMELKIADDL